jgi:secreted trypsin-like serine protease
MAALLSANNSDSTEAQFCGATLIAPQYLATAAHCVTSFDEVVDASSIEVLLGENALPFGRGNRLAVIGVFPHPNYNPITVENDVALVKLEKPVTSPFLRTLQPGEEALVSQGSNAKLVGWGSTNPNLPILPTNLQEVIIPIHSDAKCLSAIGRWFKPLSMLCAGVLSSSNTVVDGKDACFGDSGGPLVVSSANGDALAATVSWGFGYANSVAYGVYGDVIQAASFLSSRPIARPVVKAIWLLREVVLWDKLYVVMIEVYRYLEILL